MRRRALLALIVSALSCGDNVHIEGGTLLVSPTLELYTDEAGATATFSVVLTSPPSEDVVVTVASDDVSEGTVSPATLMFHAGNYDRAQTVTITGVDDFRVDGEQGFHVLVDAGGRGSADLSVTNGDDDTAGILVSPIIGLSTSEGGTTATFTVALGSEPSANVVVPVASSDATEGTTSVTALTFTPASFGPQTVTVTGVSDVIADGDVVYSIVLAPASSADTTYDGFDADDVQVTNIDDVAATISVTPTSGLVVSEAGTQATFTVELLAPPTSDVTLALTSSDTSEATVDVSSLVFTTANWNTPRTVTVTGVDDLIDDGNVSWTIVLGAAGFPPSDVTGTTIDDDTAGVTVTAAPGLTTTESGGTATFTVQLTSQPTADVTIGVSSSNAGEGVASPTSLVFTDANWMTAQTITITGVDDTLADGPQTYSIVLAAATSTDASYSGLNPPDVTASNTDNDGAAAFVFDTTTITVSEFRDSDVFAVSLSRQPTANVTITFASSDTSEGTVNPTTLTFTPQNWSTPQPVTVTGVDDNVSDGPIAFSIVTNAATSMDPAFDGVDPPDVAATNLDNDTAAIYVKARSSLFVTEGGSSTTFRVRLTVAPTANVSCPVSTSDATEGTTSPASLVFTPTSFGYQTVTITGVDDTALDGDVQFIVVLSSCTSTDLQYNGVNPRDVAVVNRDDD